jgi:hypothetical protein
LASLIFGTIGLAFVSAAQPGAQVAVAPDIADQAGSSTPPSISALVPPPVALPTAPALPISEQPSSEVQKRPTGDESGLAMFLMLQQLGPLPYGQR